MTLNKGRATTPCKEIVEGRQPPVFAADLQELERWIYNDASVPYGGRQEFEIPDLQLAAFFDENDFDIEIGIQATVLLQFFYTDPLSLRRILKFLRLQFSVDLAAQTCLADVVR